MIKWMIGITIVLGLFNNMTLVAYPEKQEWVICRVDLTYESDLLYTHITKLLPGELQNTVTTDGHKLLTVDFTKAFNKLGIDLSINDPIKGDLETTACIRFKDGKELK